MTTTRDAHAPIQLQRTGPHVVVRTDRLADARAQFDRDHVVRLPQFLDAMWLGEIDRLSKTLETEEADYEVGHELKVRPGRLSSLMEFLANTPALFDAVRALTGAPAIGNFSGRAYLLRPGQDDAFDWHDDLGSADRLVTLSINLGAIAHDGGMLQIRDKASTRVLAEVANRRQGDAVMFRIAPELEHRVTPVEGLTPRLTYVGWFRSGASFAQVVARRAV